MVARSQLPLGIPAKISLFVNGCGCWRRISRMAARGPVILADSRRNRFVSTDRSCRRCECLCVQGFKSDPRLARGRESCKSFATDGQEKRATTEKRSRGKKLLDQQHLARALDRLRQAALIVRGHARVLARKDAALVGHILAEQVRVLEIQRVLGEVNLRLRTGRAVFR